MAAAELSVIVLASLEANCKILVMVVLGVIATFKGVFDSKGISDLGRLVYHITLPSLLFSKILKEFSIDRFHTIYWLPVFCALHTVAAFFISRVLGCLLRISRFELRVVMGSLMFGNVGALAIAVFSTLCASEPLLSAVGPACEARAVSYIAWYLIAQNVIMFSWGEALLFAEADDGDAEPADPAGDEREPPGAPKFGRVSSAAAGLASGGAADAELAGGQPPFFLHSATSAPSRLSPSSSGGLGALSRSVDSLAEVASAASANTGQRVRRHRFRSAAACARPGDDAALIRRSSSYQQRRLSRAPQLSGGMAALLAAHARDDDDDDGDDGGTAPTLSYAEIQQAASRVGLEILAFHPMHHASASMLASAAPSPLGPTAEPLLPRGAGPPAARPAAALRALLAVAATRTYSVGAGVLKNPPIQAALLAVALSAYPPVKTLLVGPEAPLRFAASAVETLGAAQVPISMLMLSGSGTINYMKTLKGKLEAAGAELPPFAFSLRAELAIVVGRLVLLPLAGYALYAGLAQTGLGLLPAEDPLLRLVILIESAVPSAQNLIMMLLVHGDVVEGEAMASVLLRQYAVSMVTFTVAAAAFQALVFGL